MKKSILFASAAIAALAFTSCSNEVDMFQSVESEKATIDLKITNDDVMLTRADGDPDIRNATLASWRAKVGNGSWDSADKLVGKTYTPGDYNIQVGNYESADDAMPNGEAGDAYYTLTKTVTLVKGVNEVTFACGKAQNSKVTVNWSGTDNVSGLAITNVVASQVANQTNDTPARSYIYTTGGDAYFYPGTDIVCTINYTYNGETKNIEKTISNPTVAYKYAFNVSANNNGTITTLTITYDNAMYTGDATSTVINAATGAEVTQ